MYKLEAGELKRGDLPEWDALIDRSSHGTIFHKTGWLEACARSLGKTTKILGCFQDGQLIGGCSLFVGQKWGVFPVANSTCAMTSYGGFVLSPSPGEGVHKQESFSGQVITSLIKEIKKEHFFYISIKNSPQFLDIRQFTSNGWKSGIFYTYYINFQDNHLESHADSLVKKNIRKAEKNRIIIEPFSDISRYYALLCETYARKNKQPPCSLRLMSELYSFIKNLNCGEMVVAKTPDDEIACAEIVIWDTRQAYTWSAASDSEYLNSGAPSLLRFDDLKRMQAKGIPKINMMTGNIPELSQFTAHFNPTLVPYFQVKNRSFNVILSRKKEKIEE
jgi:hypothetical protein